MDRRTANIALAVILETVAHVESAPEGPMYAALIGKVDFVDFRTLVDLAASMGLVTKAHNVLSITSKGREMVAKIEAYRKPIA